MPFHLRPRRLVRAALTGALVVFAAACASYHPDTIFHSRTEFNREVGSLFSLLIWLGTGVFIFVEAILIYTLIRYRSRPGQREPEHVHGNTTLEILWTAIPALILVLIAIPTVRTIFRTQATARADALQVEVIGHQWWWEFRYPQYNIVTANELYLPIGRTVNFTLKTQDVLHSFWIPSLGGKRDLIANRVNHLWFTPDSTTAEAWNGFCAEYCGTSHANMKFRTYTVSAADFASWAAHQGTPAAYASPVPGAPAAVTAAVTPAVAAAVTRAPTVPAAGPPGVGVPTTQPNANTPAPAQAGFVAFPREQMKSYAVPHTPVPDGLSFDTGLQGDAGRGEALLRSGGGSCLGCHTIKGNPMMIGQIGPNLTHVGSRNTIAAGLYPNDARHLALWIKNARAMKPGSIMPTLGAGQYDPILKAPMKTGGLTDQQIADIVAYLQALK